MEKAYQPKYIEQKWRKTWEEKGYFQPSKKGKSYCIVIPPPNVTGSLHMGHGFQYSLMDALIRYHRMLGDNTLWQVGTDHAGIATQMLVTQKLLKQNLDPKKMSRDEFLARAFKWKDYSEEMITEQMRRVGISVDWQRLRFTMDDGLSKAVQKAFIDLYEEGLIYRGKKLVNWDPILKTAVSDLEVNSEDQNGYLWYIRYPLQNNKDHLIVATTRPETILGDTAIAVNPKDERFQNLIGEYARVPFTERLIPIIADNYVDPEFGTGCVKITPAHDFNDYKIGLQHDLPMINIFNSDATLNENVPESYRNLDRFTAREKIIADLKAANLLEKIEPHQLKIPFGDRSGTIIEPFLTDQWFVRTEPLAKPAIAAVEKGEIKFIPETWTKTYLQWLYNIEDWCISRQLIWGHRIPAWYDEENNIYVGENEEEIRKKYNLADNIKLHQDNDVLDTWFSSALWPFSTLGWPEKTEELKTFYPTSVLVTGFDIIFFWVARMVMMGIKFTNNIPFHEVYITGLIRDAHGQKMSKSKGNVLDPIDLVDGITLQELLKKRTANLMQDSLVAQIEKATKKEFPEGIHAHGMDALRFTFCALASTGRDINFDLNRLEGYRNFCNKIWNAARFALQRVTVEQVSNRPTKLSIPDAWLQTKLQNAIKKVHEAFLDYRFDVLAQIIYEFIWREYCDWYLELYKIGDCSAFILISTLEQILRLIHPLMPFISEEIWQQTAPLLSISGETIMLQPYPKYEENKIDNQATEEIEWLKQMIINIRNIRGEMNISPSTKLKLILAKGDSKDKKYVTNNQHYLINLAKLESTEWANKEQKVPVSATAVIDKLELYIPIADIIDIAAERVRLEKEITRLKNEIERSEAKLNNSNYIAKAPQDIVQKEREHLAENRLVLTKLIKNLQTLS